MASASAVLFFALQVVLLVEDQIHVVLLAAYGLFSAVAFVL
jgi:hypothetical protein